MMLTQYRIDQGAGLVELPVMINPHWITTSERGTLDLTKEGHIIGQPASIEATVVKFAAASIDNPNFSQYIHVKEMPEEIDSKANLQALRR